MDFMDNLNNYLYLLFGAFCVAELVIRVLFPLFRKNPWMETIDSLWVAMAIALSLKAVLVQPFTIPSGSMEDTLLVGDYILVKKYEYGYSFLNKTNRFLQLSKPQRRDVVVFQYPVDPSKDFIKRCVGVPGDILEYKKKVLYVNGIKQEEPYVKHSDPGMKPIGLHEIYSPEQSPDPNGPLGDYTKASRDNFGPVTVQQGHYFMMGDNRDNSWDCRYWNQLDEKRIKGRAWVIYWHSVTYPVLFALIGMVTALVSLIYWILYEFRKRAKALKGSPVEEEKDGIRTASTFLIIAVIVGGLALSRVGLSGFKESCGDLKERIFTVIR